MEITHSRASTQALQPSTLKNGAKCCSSSSVFLKLEGAAPPSTRLPPRIQPVQAKGPTYMTLKILSFQSLSLGNTVAIVLLGGMEGQEDLGHMIGTPSSHQAPAGGGEAWPFPEWTLL